MFVAGNVASKKQEWNSPPTAENMRSCADLAEVSTINGIFLMLEVSRIHPVANMLYLQAISFILLSLCAGTWLEF